MVDKTGHIIWHGAGPTDGNPDMITSYRSELAGITILLFLLQQIVKHQELRSGTVILYCDNQGALDNVFALYPKRGIYPLLERDYDLLEAARHIRSELPTGYTTRRMPLLHPQHEATLLYSGSIITTTFRDIIYKEMFTQQLQANIRKKRAVVPAPTR
mmetsp:Transcript_11344/g.16325  ORF Transcript_11344/g.16325 Transcript_11344/m.16325 type:complete len:158 (-) Transcript_11344:730-1203(-)